MDGLSNHWDLNIVDISGALLALNLNILILNSQYEEGARNVNSVLGSTLMKWISDKMTFLSLSYIISKICLPNRVNYYGS